MENIVKTNTLASISYETALKLIAAANEAADEIGIAASVAITDIGGHLVAFARADKAPYLTIDAATDKAWTATSFGLSTHVWNAILQDKQAEHLSHRPRLIGVAGGFPIIHNGSVIGGLGISGGSSLQDKQVGEAALSKLGFEVQ